MFLLASRADRAALGTLRTHGCCCWRGTLTKACPAHVLWAQRADLRIWFPETHSAEGVPRLGPSLFSTSSGKPCSILGITAIIEAAAVQVGLPRRSPEGLTLWTWHLLRVGGAQSLAIAGLDVDLLTRGPVEHRGCSGLCQVSLPGHVTHLGRTSIRRSCAVRTVGHCRFKIHPAALQHELAKLKESSTLQSLTRHGGVLLAQH